VPDEALLEAQKLITEVMEIKPYDRSAFAGSFRQLRPTGESETTRLPRQFLSCEPSQSPFPMIFDRSMMSRCSSATSTISSDASFFF